MTAFLYIIGMFILGIALGLNMKYDINRQVQLIVSACIGAIGSAVIFSGSFTLSNQPANDGSSPGLVLATFMMVFGLVAVTVVGAVTGNLLKRVRSAPAPDAGTATSEAEPVPANCSPMIPAADDPIRTQKSDEA